MMVWNPSALPVVGGATQSQGSPRPCQHSRLAGWMRHRRCGSPPCQPSSMHPPQLIPRCAGQRGTRSPHNNDASRGTGTAAAKQRWRSPSDHHHGVAAAQHGAATSFVVQRRVARGGGADRSWPHRARPLPRCRIAACTAAPRHGRGCPAKRLPRQSWSGTDEWSHTVMAAAERVE